MTSSDVTWSPALWTPYLRSTPIECFTNFSQTINQWLIWTMAHSSDKMSFIIVSNNRVTTDLNYQLSTNDGFISSWKWKNSKLLDCGFKVSKSLSRKEWRQSPALFKNFFKKRTRKEKSLSTSKLGLSRGTILEKGTEKFCCFKGSSDPGGLHQNHQISSLSCPAI